MRTLNSPPAPALLINSLSARLDRAEAKDRVFITLPIAAVRALLPLAARSLPLTTEAIPGLTEALGPVRAAQCYRELATAAMAAAEAQIVGALRTAMQLPPAERAGFLQAQLSGVPRPLVAVGGQQ